MSRFRLFRHLLQGLGGVVPAYDGTAANAPTLSGVPRESATAWIGAGFPSGTPNTYRYTLYRDGVLVAGYPVVQSAAGFEFAWVTADVGHAPSATVEASADGGSTWGAPATALNTFTFASALITPATIPDGTLTRTSASTVLPLTFDVTAAVYSCYKWQIKVEDTNLTTVKYFGEKGVSESELLSPFTMDLSGATDPVPAPPLPSLAADDVVSIRLCSADFVDGVVDAGVTASGPCTNWMSISPTDRTGPRYWRIDVASTANGFLFLDEIALAHAAAGADAAPGRVYFSNSPVPGDPDNNGVINLVNGNTGPGLIALPGYLTVDFGLSFNVGELRITSLNNGAGDAPASFTFSHSTDNITFTAATLTPPASGLSWATGGETKTFGVS